MLAWRSKFEVVKHACGLPTEWSASYEVGRGGKTIGFNSEMDALRGIGHACGLNLIGVSGCAAAIGVAAALREHNIPGRVLLLGTPGEEADGGKLNRLAMGAYKGMEACLMVHPGAAGNGSACLTCNCIAGFSVTFTGKSSHAAGAPKTTVNALDAAIAGCVNVSLLRQQIPSSHRVHGTISGSDAWSANVIPSHATVEYCVRAPAAKEVTALVPRILKCFEAAALATGCTYQISTEILHLDLQLSSTLADYYQEFCEAKWGKQGYQTPWRWEEARTSGVNGMVKQGDVTYRLPGLHPMFMLSDARGGEYPHSDSYASAASTPGAHQAAIEVATAIAVVGSRVIIDQEFGRATRESWNKRMYAIKAEQTFRDLEDLRSQYPWQHQGQPGVKAIDDFYPGHQAVTVRIPSSSRRCHDVFDHLRDPTCAEFCFSSVCVTLATVHHFRLKMLNNRMDKTRQADIDAGAEEQFGI